MKKDDGIKTCKICGKPIGIITWGIYRKTIVDLIPIMVKADLDGEDYVRIDGSKVKAVEVAFDSVEPGAEPAYRMHRKSCEGQT